MGDQMGIFAGRPGFGPGDLNALLQLSGLTKAYGSVVACSDISFDIAAGEIHALLGENGAGKSTLVKMVYGLVRPDTGAMTLRGEPYTPSEPWAARGAGVGMVFQHFSLFDALTVAENIDLGLTTPIGRRDLARRISEVSATYGLPLDPARQVGDLSAGERQRVEIVRCLLQEPKLLIMDEPTSVLTPQEVDVLFATLRKLSAEGTAILFISHKLEEIRKLCDRATILRRGKVVARCVPRDVSAADMAEMMVGEALTEPVRHGAEPGEVLLSVKDLSLAPATPFGTPLRNIDMEVRAGEVLGIGGVAGNGQSELFAALSGEQRVAHAAVLFRGEPVGRVGPEIRRKLGLMGAPEERIGHAAVPDMSLLENALLTGRIRRQLVRWGLIGWGKARSFAETIIAQFDVRTDGPRAAARSLSGGNLQKFVVGREILQAPDVLIVNQPTWGVDAAAAASIRAALLALARGGAGVIVISQDLDEVLAISDRFCALNEGRLSAPRPAAALTMQEVGLMLGGAHDAAIPLAETAGARVGAAS